MSDDIWKRKEIESPCVKLCSIHPTEKICVGCYRTLEEIGNWSRMMPETRQAIMASLPERAPRLRQRRGGHGARVNE
ncbi:DUF1289 domain-containing protein [Pseudothioclava nitratireducens]|jgi:hypothetical protein|uniref:DUF1289 domain-containing protein n=1 Tax=Pseudothioclava nitratireducens TaxID=1928646 RepID=UPI0023DC6D71|nr:DUF1289 domain-containing protein [Defluviimonas nitratireducens]MDF1619431.1 DUF1289 domain-containing protein [Defluviimonas nitratireducens]